VEGSIQKLYHGTLVVNLPSIRATGLVPRIGSTTAGYHVGAVDLVYAVDEGRKPRLVKILAQQMVSARLIRWSEGYQLNDLRRDLIEHAAVVVVPASNFVLYPGDGVLDPSERSRHPRGAEPGDWYSCETVVIVGEMIGQEMLDWLKITESQFVHDYRELIRRRCS